jgi:hypothetical protein
MDTGTTLWVVLRNVINENVFFKKMPIGVWSSAKKMQFKTNNRVGNPFCGCLASVMKRRQADGHNIITSSHSLNSPFCLAIKLIVTQQWKWNSFYDFPPRPCLPCEGRRVDNWRRKKEIKGMRIFRRVGGSIFIRLVLSNRAVETEEGNWAELPWCDTGKKAVFVVVGILFSSQLLSL